MTHLAWFCLSTSQQRPWVLLCERPGAGSAGEPWTMVPPSPTAPSPGRPRRSILLSIRSFIRRVSPEIPLCPRRTLETGTVVLKGPGWSGVGEPVLLENHPPAPSVHHLSSPRMPGGASLPPCRRPWYLGGRWKMLLTEHPCRGRNRIWALSAKGGRWGVQEGLPRRSDLGQGVSRIMGGL